MDGCIEKENVEIESIKFKFIPNGSEAMYIAKYREGKIIGTGSFGTVYEVKIRVPVNDNSIFAVKKINLEKINRCCSQNDIFRMKQEISLLKSLDHPNIVKVHEIFESKKVLLNFYFIN